MESERNPESELKTNNISLAEKLTRVVLTKMNPEYLVYRRKGYTGFLVEGGVTFTDLYNPEHHVEIHLAITDEVRRQRIEHFSWVPKEFKFPVLSFANWNSEGTTEVNTPYGRLSDFVISHDNELYCFRNFYFLTLTGEAIKFEKVIHFWREGKSLEEMLWDYGLEGGNVKKVDFVPHEEDSRYVDLTPDDYQKIHSILEKIDLGEFVLHR